MTICTTSAGMVAGTARGISTIGNMEFGDVAGCDFLMGDPAYYDAPLRNTRVSDFRMGVTLVTNAQMNAYIHAMGKNTHGTIGVGRDGREHVLSRGPDGGKKIKLHPKKHPHLRVATDIVSYLYDVPLVPSLARYQQFSSTVFARDDHPAVLVTWREAVGFAAWVSHVSGIFVRLPTEAEWELVAKGGSGNNFEYATHDGKLLDANGKLQAHVEHPNEDDSQYGTSAVKQYRANPLGFYDLCGNVWEWILDFYLPYDLTATDNPIGPSQGSLRVIRGGSWSDQAIYARSTYRLNLFSFFCYNVIGFRLVAPEKPTHY